MIFFRSVLYRYKFTIILGILIVFLSLLPSSSFPSTQLTSWRGFDKLIHFSMYAVLSFAFFFEMRCNNRCGFKYLITCTGILAFSLLMEAFQKLFTSLERSADLFDFLANFLGILSGMALYTIYRNIKS